MRIIGICYSDSFKSRSEFFQRSFFNSRNIRPRNSELFGNLLLRHRSAHRAVDVSNSVSFTDYFTLSLVKFFQDKPVQPLRVDFKLGDLLDVDVAGNYVLDCESISLGIAFDRLADVKLGLLVLHLAEVHFDLASNNTVEEIMF